MVPSVDDEDDEGNEPHNDDEHDDDVDSGSTVVVDEGSNSGDFESYLPMTRQLLKYPARLEKLQSKVLELQTSDNTLRNSNIDLGKKLQDTKKELKSARRNNNVVLEKLEEKELEVEKMKTKCDHLERENEELSRKYAASEQKREQTAKAAYVVINRATTVSDGCDALTAELEQQIKANRALRTGMFASVERSHSPVHETITGRTEPPGQAGHQETPRKTHPRPSNIPATSKISQNPHLGLTARAARPPQQSPTRHALISKSNNAHVLPVSHYPLSSNGREGTGTSAKNIPTAQGSENIAQGDTERLQTESPDWRIFMTRLADDHGGQTFSYKREWSDDERPQTTSKKVRN